MIGTHSMLRKEWDEAAGLLVVDEEQRFGVTHRSASAAEDEIDVITPAHADPARSAGRSGSESRSRHTADRGVQCDVSNAGGDQGVSER